MGGDKKKELTITNPQAVEEVADENEREEWGHQCEFFLSCLGYAVGFGNVWRFPYLCFKNGGAAFLIPYVTMLLLAGLPMFFMELSLGQYVSLGPNILFPEISPVFSGVGWAMLATTGMVALYYNMVFAWSLFYTFASFNSVLPWGNCDNDFNSEKCFTFQDSQACRNQSMFYFNKTCIDIIDYCNEGNMDTFNETHCVNPDNATKISPAEQAVGRISSSEDYYKNRMLGVTGHSWENMGGLRWELVGCLALAWTIVCACMIKGVKSSGKVVYFSALFPYAVLLILFVRGVTLDGAYDGIKFYILQPNMTKLWEVQVWNDAATQIFYSLSTAFGGLITLSSYNKFSNNCMRDAILIAIANCATSVFAGFVIFSILGFMAKEIDVDVKDVVDSGSGLAFIAYPAAVARMPVPPLWSILFFSMLITLGIDSQFTFVETLATGIFDRFEWLRPWKSLVMMLLCFTLFLLGLPCCLNGGVFMFELLNYYCAGLSVLFIAICEMICVMYFYGYTRFMKNIKEMGMNIPLPLRIYWSSTWLFLTPASLLVILVFALIGIEPLSWGTYLFPTNIQALGWCTTAFSMIAIPVLALYVVFVEKKRGKELTQATPKFCPAKQRRLLNKQSKVEGAFKYTYDNDGFAMGIATVYPPESSNSKNGNSVKT